MSNIALVSPATGTATFSITTPSGTSTDRTLTLPDNSGTVLTNATTTGFPAGSVLQVVSTSSSTVVTASGGTETQLLSLSITPSSASNKVLILTSGSCFITVDTNGYSSSVIRRGSITGSNLQTVFSGLAATGLAGPYGSLSNNFLDSPSTTSAQAYTFSFNRGSGGTTSVNTENVYSLTLMEIAA
jgi:hypothetical protein